MRKGALPIPYIIALIIGVIVVAVLAYWFISSSGKGSNVGKEAECRGRILQWCVGGKTASDKEIADKVCNGLNINYDDICKTVSR